MSSQLRPMHASQHPAYLEVYQRNKRRLGKQPLAEVAQVRIAGKLTGVETALGDCP